MQLPPPDPDTLFADLLQDLPPETLAMAYEFKAFTRARKIKTPQQLLRAVLLYCALDQSLREVAGTLHLLGSGLTDSSVAERLAACRPWIKALLPKMLATAQVATVPHSWRWIVVDGSTVQGPGAKGIDYRLHIGLDLVSLDVTHLLISDVKTGESLRHFAFGPAQAALADRGYSHPQAVADTVAAGTDVVVRLNPHNMPLYDAEGTPVDVLAVLQPQAPTTVSTVPVWVGPAAQRVAGWVHAYRLSEEQANRARQACYQRNSKKGHTPQARTVALAAWVLVWTSIAPAQLDGETILRLYRLRWQVELGIKRWKSLLDVDALRARQGRPLAELWVHGKLLYALLVDRRMRRLLGDQWGRLDGHRRATWWRPWKLVHQALMPLITGSLGWAESRWSQSVAVVAERPRQRQLQRLPDELWWPQGAIEMALEALEDDVWEESMAA